MRRGVVFDQRVVEVACVIGLPVIPVNMTTGQEESGFVDFYWYKKATGEIKYIGGA
ncbi:MAG: hypothetical protein IJG57_05745 [Firmicutes bacterium]|nr:hypothetical protein [Bacillota bacterium]